MLLSVQILALDQCHHLLLRCMPPSAFLLCQRHIRMSYHLQISSWSQQHGALPIWNPTKDMMVEKGQCRKFLKEEV